MYISHILDNAILLFVPGMRYWSRKYKEPTNIIGNSRRLTFFFRKIDILSDFTGCKAYTQPEITVKRGIRILTKRSYRYLKKESLVTFIPPSDVEPITCPNTTSKIAIPRKVSMWQNFCFIIRSLYWIIFLSNL